MKHFSYVLFYENITTCEIMWKNKVEPDRPQVPYYGTFAVHAG